jgi:Family of unknown function (DUF6260)
MSRLLTTDYILNGEPRGGVASRLLKHGMNPNVLRPYEGDDGRSYITINQGGKDVAMVTNAPALLRVREWIAYDQAIQRVARKRLRLWNDIVSAGLTYSLPNGMAHTVLQSPNMTDAGNATLSMNGRRRADSDRPLFDLVNLPLPIVHADFDIDLRSLEVSRNGGMGVDTTMAEQMTHKIVELIEQLTIGVLDTYSFGGGTIYGLINHPSRMTYSASLPTGGSWTPNTMIRQLLAMMQQGRDAKHYGNWRLYNSPAWDAYLDDDYSATYGGKTLRQRIGDIENLEAPRTLDYLTGYQLIMVEMQPGTIRAVTGMPITPVMWETEGGMDIHMKIMAIMVPQVRADAEDNTGIIHAVAV